MLVAELLVVVDPLLLLAVLLFLWLAEEALVVFTSFTREPELAESACELPQAASNNAEAASAPINSVFFIVSSSQTLTIRYEDTTFGRPWGGAGRFCNKFAYLSWSARPNRRHSWRR